MEHQKPEVGIKGLPFSPVPMGHGKGGPANLPRHGKTTESIASGQEYVARFEVCS